MEGFDRSRWPIPLATAEDYQRACDEFVCEYLATQAEACLNPIQKLQAQLEATAVNGEIEEDDFDKFVQQVEAASTFPKEINDFLEEVAALEHVLEAKGAFNEES